MGEVKIMAALGRTADMAARAAKFALRGSLLGTVLLAAASCAETAPRQSMPCPMVQTVPDAAYVTRFAGESEDLTDTDFEAQIAGIQSKCIYVQDQDKQKSSVRSELLVKIAASRGPKHSGEEADVKYYVALTGQGGKLIMRKDFTLTVPLTADKPTATVVDDPMVVIPMKKGENGDYFRVYVYFDVSEKELAYNRRNPRQ
jgi:hypothetical protein